MAATNSLTHIPFLTTFPITSIAPLNKFVATSFTANPTVNPVIPIPVSKGDVSSPSVPKREIMAREYVDNAIVLDTNRAAS